MDFKFIDHLDNDIEYEMNIVGNLCGISKKMHNESYEFHIDKSFFKSLNDNQISELLDMRAFGIEYNISKAAFVYFQRIVKNLAFV